MTTISCGSWLPEDLIVKILLRLSVIALLRFKLVCKRWCSIISSSRFAYNHFHQKRKCTYPLVCWGGKLYNSDGDKNFDPSLITIGKQDYSKVFFVLLFPDVDRPLKLDTGIFPRTITAVCGPCNGIICVRFENCELALWNPATRRLWPVPSNVKPQSRLFSFWMDPLTNQFKVFYIKTSFVSGKHLSEFVRYSSCNDSWRHFQGEVALLYSDDKVPCFQCRRYTVSNGFYYYTKISMKSSEYAMVAFDIFNDLFEEIQMPKIDSFRRGVYLDLYCDSLTIFSLDKEAVMGHVEKQCVEIWSMKETGCWTKLFNVVQLGNLDEPIGFWKRNELFITNFCEDNLMIYDTVSGEARKLEYDTGDVEQIWYSPLCYKESLISVNKI